MSVTFGENLSRLLAVKKEAQSLLQLYSKDVLNFSHVENLENKTLQLRKVLSNYEELREKSVQDSHVANMKIESLRGELGQSKAMNNDLLQKLEDSERENHELVQELTTKDSLIENMKKEQDTITQKYVREMENLKLMYTQELYIAKRFDKPR